MSEQALLAERFFSKVVMDSRGCWEWKGAKSRAGYGLFQIGPKHMRAHRVAWLFAGRELPVWPLQMDHLCRNTSCVNIDHLRVATPRENTLNGVGPTAKNAEKTHCVRGHEFTEANTYKHSTGRYCVTCRRATEKERNKTRKRPEDVGRKRWYGGSAAIRARSSHDPA